MKYIYLKKFYNISFLEQLQQQLGGSLSTRDNEIFLKIDNEVAKGSISQFTKRDGISFINYNIIFFDDIRFQMVSDHPINYEFLYSMESNLLHNFGNDSDTRQIEKFRSVIFGYGKGLSSDLHFTKDQKYILSTINISTVYKENDVNLNDIFVQKLQSIFKLSDNEPRVAYIGSLNLKIADTIQQLEDTSHDGIVRSLLIEAAIKTIIALQLQQHSDDLENLDMNIGTLTRKEMATIQEISTMIKKHPEKEYTISSICQQSGLSKAKLQEGFRLMHGLTVTKYIRHTRILAAEHLIKTTDLNISEVVYSIGLTSRSYFSKIFKKKYNCSPKDYQLNRQLTYLSA